MICALKLLVNLKYFRQVAYILLEEIDAHQLNPSWYIWRGKLFRILFVYYTEHVMTMFSNIVGIPIFSIYKFFQEKLIKNILATAK